MINRQSIQETTGTDRNVAQSFKQNIFFDVTNGVTSPSIFEVPMFSTTGGTRDYYGQNPLAIFTNLVKPFITFDFSANTSSFGTDVYIKHDIYRIDWDVFGSIQSGYKVNSNEGIKSEREIVEIIEEVDQVTGAVSRKTITRSISETNDTIKSSKKVSNLMAPRGSVAPVTPTVSDLQDMLDIPLFSITASTTGITTNVYDFQIDQFTKRGGEYKTELFQDKCQYIIDTNFIFGINVTPGLVDYEIIDSEGNVKSENYSATTTAITSSEKLIITGGEFQGVEFIGADYFTYFQIPDKPIFEYPTPSGQISTFTPEIFWSNGENADSYLVQVTYNTGDTGFTGAIFSYIVPKTDDFKETAISKTNESTTEFSSSKSIRKYQLSLKSNNCIIYRVGNVKEIVNIFGVKQSVVTFSENKSICTQTEPIKIYVYTESDSPYSSELSELVTPPSIIRESPLREYSLSGLVSGSTVTGATMQLTYPNSSYVTAMTNSVGEFSFGALEEGVYTLDTTYRGYASDSTSINLTGDTSVYIEIQIRWDNTYDAVSSKENDTIKY